MKIDLKPILDSFNVVTFQELGLAAYHNRVDTKYVVNVDQLPHLMEQLQLDYLLVTAFGQGQVRYETSYFDTSNFQVYLDHHAKRESRFKVRKRKYSSSDDYYIEVKKRFKGRTQKIRSITKNSNMVLCETEKQFIENQLIKTSDLQHKIRIDYDRITLTNFDFSERVTLDSNLCFSGNENEEVMSGIVVIEVKKADARRYSAASRLLKKQLIRSVAFSKFCMGMSMVYPNLKSNNFKEIRLRVSKIS